MLDTCYRLSPELLKIPSKLFYNDRLGSANYGDNKEFMAFSSSDSILTSADNAVLFLHHEFDSLGRSPFEAKTIASIVKDLLDNGVAEDDIAIITPYLAQVREIKMALCQKGLVEEYGQPSILVDTIERMQGQERRYILFSLSNSNPSEVEDRLDFFYNANRLNVALTRANTKCIVIANEKVFQLCNPDTRKDSNNKKLVVGQDAFWNYFKLANKMYDKTQNDEW